MAARAVICFDAGCYCCSARRTTGGLLITYDKANLALMFSVCLWCVVVAVVVASRSKRFASMKLLTVLVGGIFVC